MASSVSSAQNRLLGLMESVGRPALATLFPNDFEVYLCTLELVTADGETIDFFTFPVMPESISKQEIKRNSIRNTAGGITVLSSPTYTPQEISIKGNFGRSFKILIGDTESNAAAYSMSSGKYDISDLTGKVKSTINTVFDASIKTGFGATRMLKAIISKSNGVDDKGRPFKLYFYNLAFGESYLVVVPPNGITFSQNMQKNMIWEYNLNMTAVAPLEAVKNAPTSTSMVKKLVSAAVTKTVNDLATYIASVL